MAGEKQQSPALADGDSTGRMSSTAVGVLDDIAGLRDGPRRRRRA